MTQPPQTGKRIVSQGEYMCVVSHKAILGLGSVGLALIIAIGYLTAVFLVLYGIKCLGDDNFYPPLYFFLCLAGAFLIDYGTTALKHMAERGIEKATQKENMLILTRANTADLRAPESLVRASEEPVQQQQAVLLRAATQNAKTPPEQLVRPAE